VRSARAARRLLCERLDGRLDPDVVGQLLLLVSELVGNAAVATTEPMDLRVTCHDRGAVRVELTDASAMLPRPQDAHEDAEDGRGLFLVESLSLAWGVTPHPRGKTVWFTIQS
jgi:two-component sensor histidine kinase